MKTLNKLFIFISLCYLLLSICALFGLINSNYIIFVLSVLFIPLALIWVKTITTLNRIRQFNRDINHALSTHQKQLQTDSKILSLEVNHLIVTAEHINNLLTEINQLKIATAKQTSPLIIPKDTPIKNKMIMHTNTGTNEPEKTPLTGVITDHGTFNAIVMKSIGLSKRKNKILALMVLDFTFDSKTDDIEAIANQVNSILRNEDSVACLDGEIIILLNDIGKPKFAGIIAEKTLSHIKQAISSGSLPALKISMGIATYPEDGDSLEKLYENAFEAVSRARFKTDSTYEFHTNAMNAEVKEYTQLESALKSAIEHQMLDLYYQPQLELRSAAIVGVEALMRWEHPVFGRVSPEKFIAIAEETGAFLKIADITIQHACNMNKQWQSNGHEHITVSVNVSPKQFAHPDLPAIISKALQKSELHPSYLELEISENTLMSNIDTSTRILDKIKQTGVGISIDHFGTGLMAISYLKKFPINTIKIDRGFINGIPNNPNDLAIVNAFISLAHHLGLRVIADGVETAEQVQYLAGQQCDWIQGFFLSHPVHSSKISSQLKKLTNEVEY